MIDAKSIMAVVMSLMFLGVGVFTYFVVIGEVHDEVVTETLAADGNWSNLTDPAGYGEGWNISNNNTNRGNSVFNIIGIVILIGAIMAIVGIVYSYIKP